MIDWATSVISCSLGVELLASQVVMQPNGIPDVPDVGEISGGARDLLSDLEGLLEVPGWRFWRRYRDWCYICCSCRGKYLMRCSVGRGD